MLFNVQTMVKTFELCDLPVRVAKFVARKNWVVAGAVSNHHQWGCKYVIVNIYLNKHVYECATHKCLFPFQG